MNVLDQYVGCNDCQNEMPVKEAFDLAFRSWPQQGWIAFKCPTCGGWNHLSVADATVLEGYLDGTPGPCFVQKRRVFAGDLRVKIQSDGIELQALNLRWLVPSA
jgi:hypothetical protein